MLPINEWIDSNVKNKVELTSIGLEIHITLKSDKKVFSPEPYNESSWISLGFLGTLPTINTNVVEKTIKLSKACNCSVNHSYIAFDRKNYFYYDLPKGYQITQYFHPIGTNGHIKLSNGKIIRIRQIHLEEDTAQQFKHQDSISFNFARLGRALAEMVTEPDFNNYEEIKEFLGIVRKICIFNELSNAAYESGEMRVDLNVSVRKNKTDPLGTKSEIKNLNSLNSIKHSIEYLVDLQKNYPNSESFTYTWSEKTNKCEVMRKKGDSSDYFYVPEANIPPFSISSEKYKEIVSGLITNFDSLSEEWKAQGLKNSEVDFLFNNYHAFTLVFRLNSKLNNLLSSYNWMVNVVSGMAENFDWSCLPYLEIEQTILEVEQTKKISIKIAKSILKEILINGLTFKEAKKRLNVSLITNKNEIQRLIQESFEQYKEQLPKLKENMLKLEKLIIGECMKKSKGQADPSLVKSEFDKVISSWG